MGLYKRSDSKTWWMSYTVGTRRVKETTKTKDKKAAAALLAKRKAEPFEGRHFPAKRKAGLTLGDLGELFREVKSAKASLHDDMVRWATITRLMRAETLVQEVDTRLVLSMVRALKGGAGVQGKPLKSASINRHLALLRTALNLAERDGYMTARPFAMTLPRFGGHLACGSMR